MNDRLSMRVGKSATRLCVVVWVVLLSAGVSAKDYLIKNAAAHTATEKGLISNSDILIRDGKITAVAANIPASKGVTIVNANGRPVTPGLINARTQLGLVEIDAVASTNDGLNENTSLSAAFAIAPAINFRSTLMPQNRINGLTRAIVVPHSEHSLFAGQGAAIALHSSMKGMLNANVAQFAVYGANGAAIAGGSRAAAMHRLDQVLGDASYLRRHQGKYQPGHEWQFSLPVTDLKALFPVLDNKTPLVVWAQRSDDILRLIELAEKHRIKLVIAGGAEAWVVGKQLAKANIAVIMDPMQNMPQFESLAVRLDGAARLHAAGVTLLFTGGGSHNSYLLRQSAGNAVANGLPVDAAIKAMTINTAKVFSIPNYGQLKAGMDADIVIWDGDPLEVTSNADAVFIQGVAQAMVSRATRLRDRYWELEGKGLPAYRR